MPIVAVAILLLSSLPCKIAAQSTPTPRNNTARPKRIRVSSGIMEELMIRKVEPVYPREAKQKNIRGDVMVRAVIDKRGHVVDAMVVKGDPLFGKAAVDAVKQWRYEPFTLNGEYIEVETTVTVTFGK